MNSRWSEWPFGLSLRLLALILRSLPIAEMAHFGRPFFLPNPVGTLTAFFVILFFVDGQ